MRWWPSKRSIIVFNSIASSIEIDLLFCSHRQNVLKCHFLYIKLIWSSLNEFLSIFFIIIIFKEISKHIRYNTNDFNIFVYILLSLFHHRFFAIFLIFLVFLLELNGWKCIYGANQTLESQLKMIICLLNCHNRSLSSVLGINTQTWTSVSYHRNACVRFCHAWQSNSDNDNEIRIESKTQTERAKKSYEMNERNLGRWNMTTQRGRRAHYISNTFAHTSPNENCLSKNNTLEVWKCARSKTWNSIAFSSRLNRLPRISFYLSPSVYLFVCVCLCMCICVRHDESRLALDRRYVIKCLASLDYFSYGKLQFDDVNLGWRCLQGMWKRKQIERH